MWKGSQGAPSALSLGKTHGAESSCELAVQLTYMVLTWLMMYGSLYFGAGLPLGLGCLTIISGWFISLPR